MSKDPEGSFKLARANVGSLGPGPGASPSPGSLGCNFSTFFLFMKLAYWMYSGPAHIGTLRVASSFKNVHAIMHAPLGDDYFNVMRSMLERDRDFTPVTTSIVDRHVLAEGSKDKVVQTIQRKYRDDHPSCILLTPTCTSSILQEDLKSFMDRATQDLCCPVLVADVNHYRVNELQAADRTLDQIIRTFLEPEGLESQERTKYPSVNLLGIFTLGFHNQHDCRELKRLCHDIGIEVNVVLPEGASIDDIKKIPRAWANIVPYREVGLMAAEYLQSAWHMPYVSIAPIGLIDTATFIRSLVSILNLHPSAPQGDDRTASPGQVNVEQYIYTQTHFISQAAWFSRSIDCQNLTGKKAFVFGDITHAAAMTKILSREMGIRVVCAGTYCTHDSDWFREHVSPLCDEVLITDDHRVVAESITRLEPAAIFGTQMERHIGKRLGIPCGVIASPAHVQNFPLGYRPFVGFEGCNQIADLVYNSFTLGMEDHLLEVFGGHDRAQSGDERAALNAPQVYDVESQVQGLVNADVVDSIPGSDSGTPGVVSTLGSGVGPKWSEDGLQELQKIPGFVRGRVKRNTENYAQQNEIPLITIDTLYEAKEALSSIG